MWARSSKRYAVSLVWLSQTSALSQDVVGIVCYITDILLVTVPPLAHTVQYIFMMGLYNHALILIFFPSFAIWFPQHIFAFYH